MSTVAGGQGNIVTNGLVLRLDAANPRSYQSGSLIWNDLTNNGYSSSFFNGVGYNTSGSGAIYFDGVDDYGILPASSLWGMSGSASITVWYNPISLSGNVICFEKGSWQGWQISPQTIVYSNQVGSNDFTTGFSAPVGTWIQITFMADRVAGQYRAYKNGNLVLASAITHPPLTTPDYLFLGCRGTPDQFSNSSIGSVHFYNRALTQSEITQNFNATRARFGI